MDVEEHAGVVVRDDEQRVVVVVRDDVDVFSESSSGHERSPNKFPFPDNVYKVI